MVDPGGVGVGVTGAAAVVLPPQPVTGKAEMTNRAIALETALVASPVRLFRCIDV